MSAHRTDAPQMAWVLGRRLREADPPLQPREGPGRPPVQIAEEPHRRGNHERADERRVDRDGEGHAEADRLDEHDVGERERARRLRP